MNPHDIRHEELKEPIMTLEDEKRDHVLTWSTIDGSFNRLHYQWHMDASDKARELIKQHNQGEIKLISLQIATYVTYL